MISPNIVTDLEYAELESGEEQYMRENALTYYILCAREGETVSEEMGEPWQHRFSLADFIKSH